MSHGRLIGGVHLIDVHLTGVHLMGVYLTGVHLMGVYLINVHLTSVRLIGVHLIDVLLYGRVHVSKSKKAFGETSRSSTSQTVVEI
jgi:uncharacterized protein YjbI with pentapeptide repeats